MRFDLKGGVRTVTATYENEKLMCFKCKRGKYDYVKVGNFLKEKEHSILWYWCEQRFKQKDYYGEKVSYIFCNRKDCFKAVCSNTGKETRHIDFCIDKEEGF